MIPRTRRFDEREERCTVFAQASAQDRVSAGSREAWASAALADSPCDSSTFAARDARDRFLPSSHSGASTRASLALDEVAPRVLASFRLTHTLLGLFRTELPSRTAFHDA